MTFRKGHIKRASSLSITVWCAILVLACGAHPLAAADVGQPAPELVVQELGGQTFDLAAQRGKVVIVNFWATWCPPCREELPNVKSVYDKYHDKGFEVVAVSLDQDSDALARYVKEHGLPWPQIICAIGVWILYGLILQGRYLRWFAPKRVAALCIIGFSAALTLLWGITFTAQTHIP